MLPLLLFILCMGRAVANAQMPEQQKVQAGKTTAAYYHAPGLTPAILLVLPNHSDKPDVEWKNWSQIAATRQWNLVFPAGPTMGDPGILALEAILSHLRRKPELAKAPVYFAGAGATTPMIIYAAARAPHLFSSAVAIGGSVKPAIESDRLFGGNTANLPIAWGLSPEEKAANRDLLYKLQIATYQVSVLESPTIQQLLDFLAKGLYNLFPPSVDCETGNPIMARCYWVTPVEFDGALRNDALRSTRVNPDTGASLDFGGFGYNLAKPGPGVLVEWLPPKYDGPLQLNDRIVALSGTPIADSKHYLELLSQVKDEKPVAVTIERGAGKNRERMRITTRYQLRKREEVLTARTQAQYQSEAKEIVIISRTVASLQVDVPPQWAPVSINWNGVQVATPQTPGCYIVSIKNPGNARPCPQEK
ncbi:MAG: hypothetical protein HY820_30840 [Acidobacteria bacterium]|nr:hypothetical protein [Acidobacteriota bacterium]